MALNYQRNSYMLWEAALKSWNDVNTRKIFDIRAVSSMTDEELRSLLLKYKIGLQPNKHIQTWKRICDTVFSEWGSLSGLFQSIDNDFLALRELIQKKYKKGFPYLSGPKIFNYWSFIISTYGKIPLKNREFIEIAPDTHITQCSIHLGVITADEAKHLSKNEISKRWRALLQGSGITPIEMHPPLWFWSRNGFIFKP